MMTADLFWNYPRDVPGGTRAWKWGMDKVMKPGESDGTSVEGGYSMCSY